jgi:hypothetical protein
MRFARQDLPGLAIATLGGPLLFLLVLASFELWGHRHTVLLAGLSQNLAIGAALIAVFSRFIRRWDAVLGLLALIVLMVIGVNWLQRTGDGTTALAVLFKWVGVVSFLLINIVIVWDVLSNALLPWLDRRAERRAATAEAEAQA